jgi:hypothetical protein
MSTVQSRIAARATAWGVFELSTLSSRQRVRTEMHYLIGVRIIMYHEIRRRVRSE